MWLYELDVQVEGLNLEMLSNKVCCDLINLNDWEWLDSICDVHVLDKSIDFISAFALILFCFDFLCFIFLICLALMVAVCVVNRFALLPLPPPCKMKPCENTVIWGVIKNLVTGVFALTALNMNNVPQSYKDKKQVDKA